MIRLEIIQNKFKECLSFVVVCIEEILFGYFFKA